MRQGQVTPQLHQRALSLYSCFLSVPIQMSTDTHSTRAAGWRVPNITQLPLALFELGSLFIRGGEDTSTAPAALPPRKKQLNNHNEALLHAHDLCFPDNPNAALKLLRCSVERIGSPRATARGAVYCLRRVTFFGMSSTLHCC